MKGGFMIKELIIGFDKNNEEKNIARFYIKCGVPLLILLQIFFSTAVSIDLFIIIIILLLYLYIYLKIEKKMSKSILYFKRNIVEYEKYKNKSTQTWTTNFLKDNGLYNKESILFIIDDLKSRKKIKVNRDWMSLLISASIAFIQCSIKEGVIDFSNLINLIAQIIPYITITVIIFITIESLKWMFKSTVQVETSIEPLKEILTDLYLKLN